MNIKTTEEMVDIWNNEHGWENVPFGKQQWVAVDSMKALINKRITMNKKGMKKGFDTENIAIIGEMEVLLEHLEREDEKRQIKFPKANIKSEGQHLEREE